MWSMRIILWMYCLSKCLALDLSVPNYHLYQYHLYQFSITVNWCGGNGLRLQANSNNGNSVCLQKILNGIHQVICHIGTEHNGLIQFNRKWVNTWCVWKHVCVWWIAEHVFFVSLLAGHQLPLTPVRPISDWTPQTPRGSPRAGKNDDNLWPTKSQRISTA